MKISLVTMIRNEMDIIRIFLKHIDSLFDKVYLVDHCSIDGTTDVLKEAVEQRSEWEYFRLDIEAKIQKKVTNHFITRAFQGGADFVFVLDADEFINVTNRSDLEEKLKTIQDTEQVGMLSWINCLPVDTSDGEFVEKRPIILSHRESILRKVVIPRACFLKDPDIHNSEGSHESYWGDNRKIQGKFLGNIIHIPIRSEKQAIRKAISSRLAQILRFEREDLSSINNYQYKYFINQMATGKLSKSSLLRFVNAYEGDNFINFSENEIAEYWKNAIHTSFQQLNITLNNDLVLSKPEKPIEFYRLIATTIDSALRTYNNSISLRFEDDRIFTVWNELIHEDLDWEIQRDHLISEIKELKRSNKRMAGKLLDIEQELEVHKNKESFYLNSKSWRITKPLRDVMGFLRRI